MDEGNRTRLPLPRWGEGRRERGRMRSRRGEGREQTCDCQMKPQRGFMRRNAPQFRDASCGASRRVKPRCGFIWRLAISVAPYPCVSANSRAHVGPLPGGGEGFVGVRFFGIVLLLFGFASLCAAAADIQDGEKPTPLSQLSEEATLEAVLRVAAESSPQVIAAGHRWQAATHKRAQDMSLPDPRLESTYFVKQHFDQWMLGLSQEIPYPGKLVIAGRIADKGAQAAYLRYQAVLRNVLADAKESYFELYYVDRAQAISAEIEKLYERYAALGAGGKEIAKPKLPEMFRAESQRAQLGYDIILLKEMREAEAQRLRGIMGLNEKIEIGHLQDVSDPVPLGVDIEKLEEVAKAHNQELAAAGIEVEKAQFQTALAKRAPIPSLTVGANYSRERPEGGSQRVDNPIGVTLGVSVPLWLGKYRAMSREARELEAAARSDVDAQRLQIRSDLAKAYFSLRNSSRLVELYRGTLLPQARQAQQSAEELYRKGDANLAALLETTSTVHNFELARLRATADFYQNVSKIERILGTALQLKPAVPDQKPDQMREQKQ